LALFTNSVITYGIAFFLLGFATVLFNPLIYLYTGSITTPENTGRVSSFIIAAMNLANFFGGYWIAITHRIIEGNDLITSLKIILVMMLIISIIAMFYDLSRSNLKGSKV